MNMCQLAVADIFSDYPHQIVAGFMLLAQSGILNYTICENRQLAKEFHHDAIVECKVNGDRFIYDMTDGYNDYPSFSHYDTTLNEVDFSFKSNVYRPFHESMRNHAKIHTCAFRYYVTLPNIYMHRFGTFFQHSGSVKERLRLILMKMPLLSEWLVSDSGQNYYVRAFECAPKVNVEPQVFFFTRLWDPRIASMKSSRNVDLDGSGNAMIHSKAKEYTEVSDLRAKTVRALKKEFGKHFLGGVAYSPYAEEMYPDLVVNNNISRRRLYTNAIHASDICVTTQGTHHCYNFSFAEEIAASRGLVTEKPMYEVPQHFHEGVNFLTYTTPDECVSQVRKLYDDKEYLLRMMEANHQYYLSHLRPDRLVYDTLAIAGVVK